MPTKLSAKKKLLFSLVAVVGFFALVELALVAVGVQPVLYTDDPYVGFSSRIPLFVEGKPVGDSKSVEMVTAANKLPWFNEQSFPREKPSSTYRIFCVGGSTTYGRPYDDRTSFCGWLRELLSAAQSSRAWEVINAGGISYASYRVAMLMEELVRYEPDLFIIYSGHNEFLERRTYSSIIEMPSVVRGLEAVLSRTRTYTALHRLFKTRLDKSGASPGDKSSGIDALPADVEAVLDQSVGPEAYTRDDEFREQVIAHFRFNLARMVDIARSVGARVIMVTPASNLRDSTPFKSEHRASLTGAERERWQTLFDRARTAIAGDRPEIAERALDEALTIDDRHAHLHYLRGTLLTALRRPAEAKEAFLRARDEDICALRALTAMRDIVKDVAVEREVPVVDFVALVESRSEHGISGGKLFLDHVHPTIEGNRLLALEILNEMIARGLVNPEASWGEVAVGKVVERVENSLDRKAHGIALRNLAKVLGWAGKFEESRKLAASAAEMIENDADAHHVAGLACARIGELDQAAVHYRRALALEPDHAEAHNDLGAVLERQGKLEEAAAHHQEALRLDPGSARVHYNLGVVYRRGGDLNRASAEFERALQIDPTHARAHNNLGLVLEKQGKLARAAVHYRRAIEIQPGYVQAHTNLGVVFGKRGDLRQAASRFALALRIKPDHPKAHYNLGRTLEVQGDLPGAVSHYRQAFGVEPTPLSAVDHLAWILATTGDPNLRDGPEALRWASHCASVTRHEHSGVLNTLAAACAEVGDFEAAVKWQARAVELAPHERQADFEARLDLYREGRPYRATASKE